MVESEANGQPDLRVSPKPITLRCEACGEEFLVLPGCVNTSWWCEHCGAAVRQDEPVGPRQKRPVLVEKPRPSVPLEMLEDELARQTMEGGIRRRSDDPRLPRLFEFSGAFTRIPGDPRVPKVVRVYGTAFTMLGAMGTIRGVYSAVGACATWILQSPRAQRPFFALCSLAIAILFILVGNALRRGRREAVYGAALACALQLIYLGWPSSYTYLPIWGGLLAVPLFVSAARHWGRLR
jgi:hypothetical protein